MLGSLKPIRDMTFVKDTAEGFITVGLCDKVIGQTVNLGVGRGDTIGDMVKTILKILGKENVPVQTLSSTGYVFEYGTLRGTGTWTVDKPGLGRIICDGTVTDGAHILGFAVVDGKLKLTNLYLDYGDTFYFSWMPDPFHPRNTLKTSITATGSGDFYYTLPYPWVLNPLETLVLMTPSSKKSL
jgi:hypothetical protein